jgi:hypothetical protein
MGGEQEKEHRNMREREGRAVLVTKERQGINPEDVQGPKRDARGMGETRNVQRLSSIQLH